MASTPDADADATPTLENNRANIMLRKAAEGGYAIPAICVYNIEGIIATTRAATAKASPAMILLFPWAQTYSSTVLATAAATAALASPVPLTVHLDHAQSATAIKFAADMQPPCFDSIMVDFSHHSHAENLRLTREWTTYCHRRGIAVEAEAGRIEGGEDGVSDTLDLGAVMTTAGEASELVEGTGVDWLAPSFGNVHGRYGPLGIRLDFGRLAEVRGAVPRGCRLVLHGTDGFDEGLYRECVRGGVVKANVNGVVNGRLRDVWGEGGGGLTEVMERGTGGMQEEVERMMDWLGSTGKA